MLPERTNSRRGTVPVSLYRDVTRPRPGVAEFAKFQRHDFPIYFLLLDLIGSSLIGLAAFYLYASPLGYDERQLWGGLGGFLGAWIVGAYLQELYDEKALLGTAGNLILRTLATCALAFGIILFCGFALNFIGSVSRVWLLSWAAAVLVWTVLTRVFWRGYLGRVRHLGGCMERALVLAGTAHEADRLAENVEWESNGHIRVAAAAALPGTFGAPTLDWVEEAVSGGFVDRVIVGKFPDALGQVNALLARLTQLAIDVTVLPDFDGLQAPVRHARRIGLLPAVDLTFRPLSAAQVRLKRLEDLVLASLLTLLVAPVLTIICVAIKLDSPGPVLFRQKRAGFNGSTFMVWKFRTMYHHARDENAVRQTSRGDSRVTRIGRFLRRTSLDELPQLFNVLVGDMSIVGPRPHPLGMTAVGLPLHEAMEEYNARHRLKPGITGWAQINGSRGEVDSVEKLQRRVMLDCHYIDNWSLPLDLWIIARTAALVVFDPNAY